LSKAEPQARRNEHRRRSRAFMPSRRTERIRYERGRGFVCSPGLDTRQRASECESQCSPACLRRLQAAERKAAKAAGQRSGSLAAAKRSGVQRPETDGVRHRDVSGARSVSDTVLASEAWPVSRLRCAGNEVKVRAALASKRNGMDVPAQVVESGFPRPDECRDGAKHARDSRTGGVASAKRELQDEPR